MADIFISYARVDRDRIERLAAALEGEGYSVWWDRNIVGGSEFSHEIEKELDAAKAVIVAWSETSVKSRWVRDEAGSAAEAAKLIPVDIDGTGAPMGFKQYHAIDLDGWNGKPEAAAFHDVARAVKARLTGEAAAAPVAEKKGWFARTFGKKKNESLLMTAVKGLIVVAIVFVAVKYSGPQSGNRESAPERVDAVAETAASERANGQFAPAAVDAASIAVLPFADLSADQSQEYFADGIAEEILNVLAKIDALDVTSRTSAFAFKSQSSLSIRDIAASLGVRHVLEGSVRTSGDTIRVTAQLIDAQSDQHLWSETFDRQLTAENLFAIQDEIAAAITKELTARVGGSVADIPSAEGGTDQIDAYETFLRGRDLFINRNYQNLAASIEELEKSVAADPAFARAWGWLSMAYIVAPAWGIVDRDYHEIGKAAAARALALDPQNAPAYTALGLRSQNQTPADYIQSIDYYERAVAADANAPTARLWLAQAWRELGFFDRAQEMVEKCLEVDPNYPVCLYTKAEVTVLGGNYELAKKQLIPVFATSHLESYPPFLGITAAKGDEVLLALMLRELADIVSPGARWIVKDLQRALSDEDYDREAALTRFEARIHAEYPDAQARLDPYVVTAYQLAFRAYDKIPVENAAEGWWWYPGYLGLKNSEIARAAIKERNIVNYWRAKGFPPQCRPVGTDDFECD